MTSQTIKKLVQSVPDDDLYIMRHMLYLCATSSDVTFFRILSVSLDVVEADGGADATC